MTEPSRPLGPVGRAAWDANADRVDPALLLTYCETLDEREILRRQVLRGEAPAERRALRQLEARIDDLADSVARNRSWNTYEGV